MKVCYIRPSKWDQNPTLDYAASVSLRVGAGTAPVAGACFAVMEAGI